MSSTDDEKRASPADEPREKEPQSDVEPGFLEEKKPPGEVPAEVKPRAMEFPEGGARAWSVVFGTAAILFCTFGYANAFG
jgi:hypothetical protein